MADKTCPKCNIPYSDPKATKCLLCGGELVVSQSVEVEIKTTEAETVESLSIEPKPKAKKSRQKTEKANMVASSNIQAITCEVTEISEEEFYKDEPKPQTVKPFDATGGFSKRNGKKELDIEQLKADNEALRKRQADLENVYREEHPEPKAWYADVGKWLVLLLVLGMLYMIYLWVESQGGLPHEFYEFLRRLRL